jgi:hypothetical protein
LYTNQQLLQWLAEFNDQNNFPYNTFIYGCASGNIRCVEWCMANIKNVNISEGCVCAIQKNRLEMVKYLMSTASTTNYRIELPRIKYGLFCNYVNCGNYDMVEKIVEISYALDKKKLVMDLLYYISAVNRRGKYQEELVEIMLNKSNMEHIILNMELFFGDKYGKCEQYMIEISRFYSIVFYKHGYSRYVINSPEYTLCNNTEINGINIVYSGPLEINVVESYMETLKPAKY